MAERKGVAVTGLGVVSAAGRGVAPFWSACVGGRSMLRPITRFDATEYGNPRAGEIEGPLLGRPAEEPAASLALEAAREALGQARLGEPDGTSAGVVLGTCLGGADAAFRWIAARASGALPASGATPASGTLSAPADHLARTLRLDGPVMTVSTACASGTAAIAIAADSIRRGESRAMLAGGVDLLSRFVVSGFWLLRALASAEVRPFDRRRDGLALGEAAGMLVLEEHGHAVRRGARVLAEIAGSGVAGDAHHMTGPSPTGDGVVRAIEAALRDARRNPEAVEFISAHGTGTAFNDRMETVAIKRVLREHAYRVPINSIKPIVGHTLGAAGALEAVLCVQVLLEGIVPPTINYGERDPECDLDYVPGAAREIPVRAALSCSSAFAGNNAALLLTGAA